MMMNKDKIISHFGMEFYSYLLRNLETYTLLWGLSEMKQVDYYSINCIFTCLSEQYGSCVIKFGNNPIDTAHEYRFLHEYDISLFCKVYEVDIPNSVILIEHIMPGTQLRAVSNIDERLSLFYNLSYGLHRKPADKSLYPTYMGWVSRITKYMNNRKDYFLLSQKMSKAEQICRRLSETYHEEMLLHGDLHHDNILLNANHSYCIIDPKGVIGDYVFDIPRFIVNEFDHTLDETFYNKYILITQFLSKQFHLPEYDIRCLTYVEMCMANCWYVEDQQKPKMEQVLFAEKMMDEFYNH